MKNTLMTTLLTSVLTISSFNALAADYEFYDIIIKDKKTSALHLDCKGYELVKLSNKPIYVYDQIQKKDVPDKNWEKNFAGKEAYVDGVNTKNNQPTCDDGKSLVILNTIPNDLVVNQTESKKIKFIRASCIF
jgi:hypothetical protein